MHRRLAPCLLALVMGALPSVVRADVPPPDGYVEECTVPKAQARTSQACQSCSAWHGDADACAKQFAGTTFASECRSYGASTWDEVWCDPKQPRAAEAPTDVKPKPTVDDAPPPSAGSSRGCSIDRAGAPAGLAWGLLAIALARRLRRPGPAEPPRPLASRGTDS